MTLHNIANRPIWSYFIGGRTEGCILDKISAQPASHIGHQSSVCPFPDSLIVLSDAP